MENMDKGLTVPKWVLINQPKVPQMPQNLSAQIFCPSPKVWYFDEKRLHWASVVRGLQFALRSKVDDILWIFIINFLWPKVIKKCNKIFKRFEGGVLGCKLVRLSVNFCSILPNFATLLLVESILQRHWRGLQMDSKPFLVRIFLSPWFSTL